AAEQFFKSRASSEINLEPTFEVQENAHMETEFIDKLQKLQQGDLPKFTETDLHKAQTELDQDYASTQKDPSRRWQSPTGDSGLSAWKRSPGQARSALCEDRFR